MPGETTELLIVGPPGTGKTTTLQRQVEHDVSRHGSEAVLIASLTKAAAAEVAGRHLPIPAERVGTLHAHCYRALGRPELTERHLDEWNEYAPVYRLSGGETRDVDDPYAPEGDRQSEGDTLLSRYQLARARLTPRAAWPLDLLAFAERWETWKRSLDLLDFADLIDVAYETVPIPPGEPRYLYVDEAQDHDAAELRLLRAWGAAVERLYLIGDMDQAVFTWRGADPYGFMYGGRVPEARRKVLSHSYRVPRAVHATAMAWIERIADRLPVAYEPTEVEGDVRRLPDATWRYPEPLIADLERQIAAGRSCMVLAACGYLLRPTIFALRRESIPFHNPYRRRNGAWNPLHPGQGVSMGTRLLSYLRPWRSAWGDEARMWSAQDVRAWGELVRADGVFLRGAKDELKRSPGVTALTDDELCRWLAPETVLEILDDPLPWLAAHALPGKQAALAFPLGIVERRGADALRTDPPVTVGTIHSVKGGESDCVYIYPDLSFAGATEWESSGPARDALVRLYYVALTRARHEVVLCSAAGRHAVDV